MADENIRLNVVVDGEEQLKQLSSSLKNVAFNMSGLGRLTKNLDAQQRGLNKALGNAGRGAVEQAKNVRQLTQNQTALSQELKRVNKDLQMLQKRLSSKQITKKQFDVLTAGLKQTSVAMRKVKARAFISDLKGIGMELKRLGKDAQFVGRSLIIGLTTPLLVFANRGLDAFKAYNAELIRFAKIADRNVDQLNSFEDAVYDLSQTFGLSRELIVGVAADFAELGISSEENLLKLSQITSEMSILGSMDVGSARELTQTMFLGMQRTLNLTRQNMSAQEKQAAAIAATNAQLMLFNAIENNTAMSFRDLAIAMPEAQAAATAFGLTMTQTAGLLAPMKAAGIDVSTAANGLKVSFQRLISPTKKAEQTMADLVDTYGDATGVLEDAFEQIQGLGVDSIQGLIDATMELRDAASDETVSKFFTDLFMKRQATRILTAIDDLVAFQRELNNVAIVGNQSLADIVNSALDAGNAAHGASLTLVDDYASIANIAKIANTSIEDIKSGALEIDGRIVTAADKEAAMTVRQELGDLVRELKDAEGVDLIDQISSQGGKAMFVELLGAANAQELAQNELNIALNSTSTAIDRMRNSFKNVAAELISTVAPLIEKVSRAVSDFATAFRNLSPAYKQAILGFGAVVASIGPLVFIFGQLKLASGVMLNSLLKVVPGLKTLSVESVASANKLMFLKNGLTRTGDTIVNTNSRFATLIATIASGNGPMAKLAGSFGRMTGVLSKTKTAAGDVVSLVDEMKASADRVASTTLGGRPMSLGGSAKSAAMNVTGVSGTAPVATAATAASPVFKPYKGMPAPPVVTPDGRDTFKAERDRIKAVAKRLAITEAEAAKFRVDQATGQVRKNGRFVSAFEANVLKQEEAKRSARERMAFLNRKKQAEDFYKQTIKQKVDQQNAAIRQQNAATAKAAAAADARAKKAATKQAEVARRAAGAKQRELKEQQAALRQARRQVLEMNKIKNLEMSLGTDSSGKLKKDFAFKGREISEMQAQRIQGGGLRGRLTRMGQTAPVRAAGAVKGAAAAPFVAAKKAIQEATLASAAFGKTAPGAFSKAATGMKAFTGSILKGIKATKLLKIALISSGIGAIFVGIGVVVALVMSNLDKFKSKAGGLMSSLKRAFKTVKDALMALISPILDLIVTIAGVGGEGEDAGASMANAFSKIGDVIEMIANAFKSLIENIIVPVVKTWTELFFGVFELIKGFVKGFMEFFKGNWGAGFSAIWDGIKGFFRAFLRILGPVLAVFSDAFFTAVQFVINIFADMFKLIIRAFYKYLDINLEIIGFFVNIWSTAVEAIPNAFGWAIEKVGGILATLIGGVAKAADGVSGFFNTISFGAIPKTNFASVEQEVRDFFAGVGESVSSVGDGLNEGVMTFFNNIASDIRESEDAVLGFFDSWKGSLDGAKAAVGDFFREMGESDSAIAEGSGAAFVDSFFEGAEEENPYEMMDELLEPTLDLSEDAGGAAGEAFANKFKEALQEIRQTFVDLVGEYLTNEIKTVTDELTSALEDQRDAALAVFEDQLEVIDKLEKAEESLTKEKQYQADLRAAQDERELNRQNYVRNRALAIYEGRIDDARMLDREEQKSKLDSAAQISDLEQKRNEDLRKENLNFLKDSIKDAKKEADAFFKEQIAAFKEASKDITKFAPQTIEDYETQLTDLTALATQFSQDNANEFAKTFDEMKTKIVDNMPNKAVTPFSYQLDALVGVAKDKYGLGTTEGDNLSVIGATLSMLDEIETNVLANTSIESAFDSLTGGLLTTAQTEGTLIESAMAGTLAGWEALISGNTGISTEWADLVDDLKTEITDTGVDGITHAIENKGPQSVLEAAIAYANESILNKWRGTVGHIISEVDGLADLMNPMIENILEAQMAFEAMEEAAKSAGSAASNAGSSGGGGGFGGGGGGGGGGAGSGGSGGAIVRYNQSGLSSDMLERKTAGLNVQAFVDDYARHNYAGLRYDTFALYKGKLKKVLDVMATELVLNDSSKHQQIYNEALDKEGPAIDRGVKAYAALKFPNTITRQYGGYVPGFKSAGVSAMLHGGEFVINSKAVSNIGMAALQALNNMRFATPGRFGGGQNVTTINKSETVNIYVENFIGEDEWFNSMVTKYDMRVQPVKDKKYNMEDRFYTTYKGASY